MKHIRTILVAAAAAALSSCATVHRDYGVRTLPADFPIESEAAWAALDLDHDGALSRDELEQQRAMGLLQDLPNADTDADGRVSRQEWDAWWPKMTFHHVWSEPMTMQGAVVSSTDGGAHP